MRNNKTLLTAALAAAWAGGTFAAPALPESGTHAPVSAAPPAAASAGPGQPARNARAANSQAPIQIEADRAEITEKSGVSVYSGRVHLKQGDLEMLGDRLEISRTAKSGEIHATLTGKPAEVRQPTDSGEMINARANRIDYQSSDRNLELLGSAELVRGKDRVIGENIRYNASTKRILANNQGQSGERVQIIIQPGQTQ